MTTTTNAIVPRAPAAGERGGAPDVRGWEVDAVDGPRVGRVVEMLEEAAGGATRYLVVALDRGPASPAGERRILVPIGLARLHPEEDRVVLGGLDRGELAAVPSYTGGAVSRGYEQVLRRCYDPGYRTGLATEKAFYEHDLFDEDRFLESRRSGGVRWE